MSKRFQIVSVGLLAAAAIAGSSVAANAGTTPTPTPTYTHPTPPPTPAPVRANWEFDVQQSNIGLLLPTSVNRVEGVGALPMDNWTDVNGSNPAIDTFRRGVNSVTLLHSPISQANIQVDRYTCTVKLDQTGRFRIIHGTGTGANLSSRNGQFELDGMLSFPLVRNNVCVLRFVGTGAILRAIQNGRPVLGVNPTFEDISVQGRALVTRTPVIVRPFAPVASPSV